VQRFESGSRGLRAVAYADLIRAVFLLWEDFQPHRIKCRMKRRRLVEVRPPARTIGNCPDFSGHMSGVTGFPLALEAGDANIAFRIVSGRVVPHDEEMVQRRARPHGQAHLAREVAARFAIIGARAYDLGNKIPIGVVPLRAHRASPC